MSENKNSHAESVVLIDENALDKECIRLPSDYLKYSLKTADKKRDADELRAQLKAIEARLGRQIRDMPGKFGLEKVTESAVTSTIQDQSEYQDKASELREAEHESNVAQAVVWALEHKKRSLTLLVELHGLGYFSNPKISERGREVLDTMRKKNVRRLREDQ